MKDASVKGTLGGTQTFVKGASGEEQMSAKEVFICAKRVLGRAQMFGKVPTCSIEVDGALTCFKGVLDGGVLDGETTCSKGVLSLLLIQFNSIKGNVLISSAVAS